MWSVVTILESADIAFSIFKKSSIGQQWIKSVRTSYMVFGKITDSRVRFFICFWPCSMQDLNSLTRDQAQALGDESPNDWTSREFPKDTFCVVKTFSNHAIF